MIYLVSYKNSKIKAIITNYCFFYDIINIGDKMKKVLFLFLLIFSFVGLVKAEEITDVSCVYTLPFTPTEGKAGYVYVQLHYMSSPQYEIYYDNEDGKSVKWDGGIFDYKNHDDNGDIYIQFNLGSEAKAYMDYFKNTGKCSPVHYKVMNPSLAEIHMNNVDSTNSKTMNPVAVYLKGVDDTKWVKESEFYAREENKPDESEGAKNMTCGYTMKFPVFTNKTTITFERIDHNKQITYSAKIGANENQFSSLESELWLTINQDNKISNLVISPATLKALLGGDKCIESSLVYHYVDNNENVHITTDGKEASDNSHNGRIGDGDGEEASEDVKDRINNEGKYLPKPPDYDMGKHLNCKELLGKDLTAIVKAAIRIMQIVAAIIAILKGMITVIPAVAAKDADALKKASKTLITLAIILLIVLLLPLFVKVIGQMLDFDLSCFL